jgi:hypothetical protein
MIINYGEEGFWSIHLEYYKAYVSELYQATDDPWRWNVYAAVPRPVKWLTFILLMWNIWWAANNASTTNV